MFWSKKAPPAPPAPLAAAPAPAAPAPAKGWLSRLSDGLVKTRQSFTSSIKGLFGAAPAGGAVDRDAQLEKLEELLIRADVGVEATAQMLVELRSRLEAEPEATADQVVGWLKESMKKRLARNYAPLNLDHEPFSVILIVGVNGVGKTTTIAKLASIFKAYGKRIMLVAGDTFRAGAIEQLSVWAGRAGVELMKGQAGGDPSALVFDALNAAKARKFDLIIVDTAGRLHTQVNLMEELKKVNRVIKKICPEGPHETLLVLDATTGQNAIQQAEVFNRDLKLSGLVMTKLDGTAKGGIIVNVCERLSMPVRFIGVGEQMDDLQPFRSDEFVEALFS